MARKSMSLLDLKAWLHHNKDTLQGSRVTNIYYDHQAQTLLLKIRPPAGEEKLLVAEPGKRIHYTTRTKPPQGYKPHPLVVTARKHMRGSRIEEAQILGGDRILALRSSTGYTLVVELLPRGVALLLDPQGTIVAATRYEKFKDRTVRPKEEYKPPPPPQVDPLTLGPQELASLLKGQKDLVRGLVRAAKLPGEYAEEAIYRAGLDPKAKPDNIETGSLERLVEAIQAIWSESLGGKGYLAPSRGEATPFKPTRLGQGEVVELPSFDEALDELYSTPRDEAQLDDGERARLQRSLEEARETARRYTEEAERLRRIASIIPAHYDRVKEILDCASRGGECPGIDRRRGVVAIEVDGETVEARIGETVDQLILRLFRQAGELEAKARRAREAERSIMERLEDLELKARARRVAALSRARKRQWYEKYHWTMTRGGLIAVGGRDASQNEAVVKRYLGDGDIFMHADIHGAPAVVLKTGGREPSPEDLQDAAVIAAAYSRAWKAGLGHVQVYWVNSDQVSKSPPTGEYLARGGFIIRGKKNYLSPVRTRLYLGLALDDDGAPMVIVGAKEPVEERSLAYVELEPGDLKVEEAAKMIKQELVRVLPREEKHLALGLPEEEIQYRIPGRARILAARRGNRRLNIGARNVLE